MAGPRRAENRRPDCSRRRRNDAEGRGRAGGRRTATQLDFDSGSRLWTVVRRNDGANAERRFLARERRRGSANAEADMQNSGCGNIRLYCTLFAYDRQAPLAS